MYVVLMMLLALALPATGQAPSTPSEAKQAFDKATAHFDKNENEAALSAYDLAIKLDPSKPEHFVGKGRTLARLRRYDEAFVAYGAALKLAPNDAMTLRYRGHNYINVGKLDLALADLTKAESIKKDEFGIYYHLALAYYLTGQYAQAAEAYNGCVRTSKTDGDRVACWAWQYPSLVRSGRTADADAILAKVAPGMEVGENAPYLDRLLLFKGVKTEDQVAATLRASALDVSTAAYGLGLWHLLNARPELAKAYFQKATSSDAWQAFGYIAAATELKNMK